MGDTGSSFQAGRTGRRLVSAAWLLWRGFAPVRLWGRDRLAAPRGEDGGRSARGTPRRTSRRRFFVRGERPVASRRSSRSDAGKATMPWNRMTRAASFIESPNVRPAAISHVSPWTKRNEKPPRLASRASSRSTFVAPSPASLPSTSLPAPCRCRLPITAHRTEARVQQRVWHGGNPAMSSIRDHRCVVNGRDRSAPGMLSAGDRDAAASSRGAQEDEVGVGSNVWSEAQLTISAPSSRR